MKRIPKKIKKINQKEFVEDRLSLLGADDGLGVVFAVPHPDYIEIVFYHSRSKYVVHALPISMPVPSLDYAKQASFVGIKKEIFESVVSLYQQSPLIQAKLQRRLNSN